MLKPLLFLKARNTVLVLMDTPDEAHQLTCHSQFLLPLDPSSLFSFHLTRLPNIMCYLHHWIFSCPLTWGCDTGDGYIALSAPAPGLGAQVLSFIQTLTHSLSTMCCHKWLTLLLWNTMAKIPILKGKFETISLRNSYLFLKRRSAVNVHRLRCTLSKCLGSKRNRKAYYSQRFIA